MDHPSGQRRWRLRPILLGVLLVVALLATLALAPAQVSVRVEAMLGALTTWLWSSRWAWPLAAMLTLVALTSRSARRRWPRPAGRIRPAIGLFVGLLGLASLVTVSRPRVGLLALGVVVVVGLLAIWVLEVPRRLAPPVSDDVLGGLKDDRARLEVADTRVKLQNELRTTALQVIAGLAVLAGAVLAFQQLTEDRQQANSTRELTLQGQASERFTLAIDQLGSDRREVQLGGIYGLEQIAQQAPDNRLAVTEVLVAYLHRRVPTPAKPPPDDSPVEELRVRASDAQAALTVLGRRQKALNDPRLDLRALDLRRADLGGVDLGGADLHLADLRRADLSFADLSFVNLLRANLSLGRADLRGAYLNGTNLSDAGLTNADLRGAQLTGVNLQDANLSSADLRGADLSGSLVGGGSPRWAVADLSGANLSGANLGGANLEEVNLKDASADQHTIWPERFDWQGAGVQSTTSP